MPEITELKAIYFLTQLPSSIGSKGLLFRYSVAEYMSVSPELCLSQLFYNSKKRSWLDPHKLSNINVSGERQLSDFSFGPACNSIINFKGWRRMRSSWFYNEVYLPFKLMLDELYVHKHVTHIQTKVNYSFIPIICLFENYKITL